MARSTLAKVMSEWNSTDNAEDKRDVASAKYMASIREKSPRQGLSPARVVGKSLSFKRIRTRIGVGGCCFPASSRKACDSTSGRQSHG